MISASKSALQKIVEEHTRLVSCGINEELGLPHGYDQTIGNRCDLLTYYVLALLYKDGLVARRELHFDQEKNWHFLIAHAVTAKPSENDVISDLNPWQWRNHGGGILHGTRNEVIKMLGTQGAPESFIALRGLETLYSPHHEPINPYAK